jgi:hypothetical protein
VHGKGVMLIFMTTPSILFVDYSILLAFAAGVLHTSGSNESPFRSVNIQLFRRDH